jgi:hypothetical protein
VCVFLLACYNSISKWVLKLFIKPKHFTRSALVMSKFQKTKNSDRPIINLTALQIFTTTGNLKILNRTEIMLVPPYNSRNRHVDIVYGSV